MDTVLNFYNIVEPWTDDSNDVCNYLHSRQLKFEMRGSTDAQEVIDSNWMATRKITEVIIYTVRLTSEEALVIKLSFPNVVVKQCIVKEKVSTLARRVLCKDTTV
jgi:hypothetical protein